MTIRGKVLLISAVAFGLVALMGIALYEGTTRSQRLWEWAIRAHEQLHLYDQFRGDALLYLEALQRAHGASQSTATVLAGQQLRLEEHFTQLHALADEEEHWIRESRPDEEQQLWRLEQALRHWTEQTEARIRSLPLHAPARDALMQEIFDAFGREVEPLLVAAIQLERGELEAASQQGLRSLRIGQAISLLVPLTALGMMLALTAAILIPMNRRLQELLAGAERIGRGEFEHEMAEEGRDEFGTLARAFNQMSRELKATQARLMFADRLASIGRLAAGVGHEINNPLAYLISNLHYVQRELSRPEMVPSADNREDLLAALADAHEGAERVRFIVQDIKTLSRADDASNGPVDLGAVVRSAARMASRELHPRARLVEDCDQVPPVWGNAARLGQVFLNLLINAAQAMPRDQAQGNEIRVVARRQAPGHVAVEVADTGCGIPPEHLPSIFDPFFTTKPVGEGTGLGLAVCHTIITQMGGSIRVESQVGRGTTFRLTLPVAPDATGT